MSADPIESDYPVVMRDVLRRLVAADDALKEYLSNPKHPNSWKSLDFLGLQIRKICELFLLGSSLAHLREGKAQFASDKWHPKDAFRELAKLNEHPLPFPIELQLNKNGAGKHHVQPLSKPIPIETLAGIYGKCGNVVHIPSAKRVLKEAPLPFNADHLGEWINGFVKLLHGHALFLPEFKIVILCNWSGDVQDAPACTLLESTGPAMFKMDTFPEFDLLAA